MDRGGARRGAEWVALYKEIRPVVQRGDLYRLRPGGRAERGAYVLGDETVVLACLQAQHHGEPAPALRLRGLDPEASYECLETGETHDVAVLCTTGCAPVCGRSGRRGVRLRRR
ncbi:hypothetical protein GCM10023238_30530 [Streptomyces heliomycini]